MEGTAKHVFIWHKPHGSLFLFTLMSSGMPYLIVRYFICRGVTNNPPWLKSSSLNSVSRYIILIKDLPLCVYFFVSIWSRHVQTRKLLHNLAFIRSLSRAPQSGQHRWTAESLSWIMHSISHSDKQIIHPCACPFIHSFIYPPIHPAIHPSSHSFNHSFMHLTHFPHNGVIQPGCPRSWIRGVLH